MKQIIIRNLLDEFADRVRVLGRDAYALRDKGQCTTGVARIPPYPDLCFEIKLDLVEGTGKGDGPTIRLGPSARLDPLEGVHLHPLRCLTRLEEIRDGMKELPTDFRCSEMLAAIESFLNEHEQS